MAHSSSRLRVVPDALRTGGDGVVPEHLLPGDGLLVAFGFRCNLACSFCMVEDLLDRNEGTSLETFRKFASNSEAMRGIERVVLSGGEATLERDLLDYVAVARSVPTVRHVRIQTNATRLSKSDYIERLRAAGVDEFFVSLHGHDAETVDAITRRHGAFKQIVAGLEAIGASGATLVTNTVMCEQNYRHLDAVVALAAPFNPVQMEFWNLWPRIDTDDERRHLVLVEELRPHLWRALEAVEARRIPSVVKWYPRCLLGRFGDRLDNSQPTALIETDYWESVPPYGCLWDGLCAHAKEQCTGLSHTYVRRFGWEEDLLKFEVGAPPARTGSDPLVPEPEGTEREERAPGRPLDGAWLDRVALAAGAAYGGWTLRRAEAVPGRARLVLVHPHLEEPLLVELSARNPAQQCFDRSPSFNVSYLGLARGIEPIVHQAMRAIVAHLAAHDPGGLPLPA